MNKLVWGWFIVGTVAYWGGLGTLAYQNHTKQVEIENLNAQMVWTVKKHNELNHKYNALKNEMRGYQEANKQLITFCRPCDVNKAIKATPLPPLEKGLK